MADQPRRGVTLGRAALLLVAALALYVLAPSITEVFEAWPQLVDIAPVWLVVMVIVEIGSFGCVWVLQRLAFRDTGWFPLISSQLASNAFSRVVPGGAAAGGALQFRMLKTAGSDTSSAVAGLTAISLITTGSVFALPLFSIPFILAGLPVPSNLALAAWLGTVLFLVVMALGAWLLVFDGPLRWAGDLTDRVRARAGKPEPDRPFADVLIEERDQLARSLGRHWQWAVAVALGKWLLDFYALVAALAATGDNTRVSLVLLAYVAGAVLAMVPITPGGLGFVEAGLTAMLVAAGVAPARAVLATLAYRLVSYWLPLMAGFSAYVIFRARQRHLRRRDIRAAINSRSSSRGDDELAATEREKASLGVQESGRLDHRQQLGRFG